MRGPLGGVKGGNLISDASYEYHGLVAKAWDFLRGDKSTFADRDFYRNSSSQAGSQCSC